MIEVYTMIKKGLVVKINPAYIIVMTEQGDYAYIHQKDGVDIGVKIMYTEEDIIVQSEMTFINKYKKYIAVASIIILLIFGLIIQSLNPVQIENSLVKDPSSEKVEENQRPTIATIITVDINPSFKLKADANDFIINVQAMNADARTIDISSIAGLKTDQAIEQIVYLAEEANFINTQDNMEDYVLVTVVDLETDTKENVKKNDETLETNELRDKVRKSAILSKVNIAVATATKGQLEEAERKNIPVGLYVAGIEEKTSVKEYFSKEKQAEVFKEKGRIIDKEQSKKNKNALKDVLKEIKEKEKDSKNSTNKNNRNGKSKKK